MTSGKKTISDEIVEFAQGSYSVGWGQVLFFAPMVLFTKPTFLPVMRNISCFDSSFCNRNDHWGLALDGLLLK